MLLKLPIEWCWKLSLAPYPDTLDSKELRNREIFEFASEKIKDEALAEDQKDAFKDFIKEKVREAKKAQREAREARKKAVEEMDEETKAAYENMRFYKFYPVQTPDAPDISQVKPDFHTGAHTWWTN
ncbi:protein HEAT INTOLERANT 4-like [Magnolia sinica]|uniref:protein HEAT INTOLERANT 4-like n=1 Tax=Magnolia sinica TaxID=86752 RepID=UPI0026594346|nr:protein HEAT INTOLERANT 4-like [Magnolia sinica]